MGIWGEMVFLLLWIELGDSNNFFFFFNTHLCFGFEPPELFGVVHLRKSLNLGLMVFRFCYVKKKNKIQKQWLRGLLYSPVILWRETVCVQCQWLISLDMCPIYLGSFSNNVWVGDLSFVEGFQGMIVC